MREPGTPPARESYRALRVWQEALQLAVDVNGVVECHERGPRAGLADQLRRAATSVHANIAEGYGRRTPRDRSRFYTFAWASLLEVEALLAELTAVKPEQATPVRACRQRARNVGRLLIAYRRYTDRLCPPARRW